MLRLLGDTHGRYKDYYNLVVQQPASLQLGDFGFNYDILKLLDSNHHKIILGNHDAAHDMEPNDRPAHILNRFGQHSHLLGNGKFLTYFYVSGEHSIDKAHRKPFIDWWPNEELSAKEMAACIALYRTVKPDILFTHGPTKQFAQNFGSPEILRWFGYDDNWTSSTTQLISFLFDIHVPKLHLHGHLHLTKHWTDRGCHQICLDELDYADIILLDSGELSVIIPKLGKTIHF